MGALDLPWAIRISRAESSDSLNRLMDNWYSAMRADRGLRAAIGFDSHIASRDWDAAKQCLERICGRSSIEYRQTLDALAAAVQGKRMFAQRALRQKAPSA